jgi:hypothetical protein
LATPALLLAATAAFAGKPHQHGAAQAQITLDGDRLTLAVQLPQHDLLGHERPPRNATERAAADTLLQRLADAATLGRPDAAAACTPAGPVAVTAPMLAAGAKPGTDDHADIDATTEWRCAQPAALKRIELGLFDAFPRLTRIEVQVAGPAGQAKASLRKPANAVTLKR